MQCSICKRNVDADSRFCKFCGERLAAPTSQAAAKKPPAKESTTPRDPAQEKEVWSGHPAWRAQGGLWFVWLTLSMVAIFFAYRHGGRASSIVLVAWIFAVGAGAAILVREALIIMGTSYRLTTQRLFVHKGILRRTTDQIELLRVDDVRITQGIVDRLVNTGDVEILSSDETDESVILESIPEPASVCEALRFNTRNARGKGFMAVEHV